MELKEVFSVLSKGVMVSLNSKRYFEVANYLNIEENFKEASEVFEKIGFNLIGENGYFYLAKNEGLKANEIESFINTHKRLFVALSILKSLFPYLDSSQTIKQSQFLAKLTQKEDDLILQKLHYLFGQKDLKSLTEELFTLLQKHYVIEKVDLKNKDEYIVLNALAYYLDILEGIQE